MKSPYVYPLLAGLILSGFAVGSATAQDNVNNIGLDPNILETVDDVLPERSNVDAEFLNPNYDPNITLAEESHVAVTFVSEGAGYRNSLGYFSFNEGSFDGLSQSDIDRNNNGNISISELNAVEGVNVGIAFDNFSGQGSGGSLTAGDTTVLGGGAASLDDSGALVMNGGIEFDAGTTVGFFVAANAYNGRGVKGFDQRGETWNYYTLDFLNPEAPNYATVDNTSEESRHVAMLFPDWNKDSVLVGFEDLGRSWGDNDFNDAVFMVRTDPVSALAGNEIALAVGPAPEVGTSALGAGLLLGSLIFVRRRHPARRRLTAAP